MEKSAYQIVLTVQYINIPVTWSWNALHIIIYLAEDKYYTLVGIKY